MTAAAPTSAAIMPIRNIHPMQTMPHVVIWGIDNVGVFKELNDLNMLSIV